jgi:hypothetical protein
MTEASVAEGESNSDAFDQCVSDFARKVKSVAGNEKSYNNWLEGYKKIFTEEYSSAPKQEN